MLDSTKTTPRVIHQTISADEFEALCAICSPNKLMHAFGYLATWNISYRYVRIHVATLDPPELVAIYKDDEWGELRYAIGAVWSGDGFGFHS